MEDNEQMIAAEPAVAYAPTLFDHVIGYLHSSQMPIETKRAVYLQPAGQGRGVWQRIWRWQRG